MAVKGLSESWERRGPEDEFGALKADCPLRRRWREGWVGKGWVSFRGMLGERLLHLKHMFLKVFECVLLNS